MRDSAQIGRLVRGWGGMLLLGALAGVLGAFVSGFRHPTTYVAQATVEVQSAITGSTTNPFDVSAAAEWIQTYRLTIRGTAVMSDAIAELHWHVTPGDLAQSIVVLPVPDTALLNVQAYAGTADEAALLANTVATVFIRRATQDRVTPVLAQRTQLESRLAANEQTLQTALARQATLQALGALTPEEQAELDGLAATIANGQLTRSGLSRDLETVRTLQALNSEPARLVDRATPPPEPIAVRGVLSLGMGALGGALAAALVWGLLALLAGTLNGAAETRTALNLPVLGVIPPAERPRPE